MKNLFYNLSLLITFLFFSLFMLISMYSCYLFLHSIIDYCLIIDSHALEDSSNSYSKDWSGLYNTGQPQRSSHVNDNYSCWGLFPNKSLIKASFKELKNNFNSNTELIKHKLKVVDRTFSWFFKKGKPGGGRGL
jgi:hypothetical protein